MASVQIQLSLLWVALAAVAYWNMLTILPVVATLGITTMEALFLVLYVLKHPAACLTGVSIGSDGVVCDVSFISSILTATACIYLTSSSQSDDWHIAFSARSLLVSSVIVIEAIMAQWPRLNTSRRIRTALFTLCTLAGVLLSWAYYATIPASSLSSDADELCRTVLLISFFTLSLRLLKTLAKMSISFYYTWWIADGDDFDPRDRAGLRMDLAEALLAFNAGIAYAPSGSLPWLLQVVLLQRLYRLVTCTNMCRRYDEIINPFPVVHGVHGDCIICLETFTEPTGCRKLHCGHHFHDSCLRKWLMQSSRCPTCRQHVFTNLSNQLVPERQETMQRRREELNDTIRRVERLQAEVAEVRALSNTLHAAAAAEPPRRMGRKIVPARPPNHLREYGTQTDVEVAQTEAANTSNPPAAKRPRPSSDDGASVREPPKRKGRTETTPH